MLKPGDLFDLERTAHRVVFDGCEFVWDALKRLRDYVDATVRPELHNRCDGVAYIGPRVFIGEGSVVEDGVMIKGPAIIGRNCQIRHNAYIREYVVIGDDCVVGNACELKHSFLFDGCQVAHLSYVGDSVLGHRAHLGAGAIISNVKSLPGQVTVRCGGQVLETGLRKLGAILGDGAEVGCNAVLNPGSVIGRRSIIYPGVCWRGVLPADSVVKNRAPVEIAARVQPAP